MSNWLQRALHIKSIPSDMDQVLSTIFENQGKVSIANARVAMEQNVWVYRAVNTVCTRLASLPWNLYQGDKVVDGKGAVLTRPNPLQTGTEFLEQLVAWQILFGFGVAYAEPLNLRSLDADMLRIQDGTATYYEGNGWKSLEAGKLVFFPNLSLSGQYGLSELSPILDAANMDSNAKSVWNNQMSSGGVLAGLLSTDVRLSEQELTAIKTKWEERYGGISKAGTMAFLGAGFKFTQMGISAADMKMLETSNVTKNEIGTAFGVPGIFLGDMQSVDYSNAQTQERILYSNTICPKADRLADRITTFLLPMLGLKGLTFKFDYSTIEALQENKLQRAQIDEVLIRSGSLTINEARLRDGLEPVDWGDAWWASAMLVPMTTAEVSAPPPPNPAPVPVLPAKAISSPLDEGKGLTPSFCRGLHTPEARNLIKAAFLTKVAPQERKFAQATMKGFNKQEKRVVAYLENGKSMKALVWDDLFQEEDMADNWHSLYVAFGLQSAEEVAARYSMHIPDGSAILAWIKKQERAHSKYVNDTTAQEIDKIISQLKAEGASIPDMVKATKEYFGGIGYRAERVARTEVISVNNMAAQNTYVENGVKEHEWLSTADNQTRGNDPKDDYSHVDADGEVVGIDEPFTQSGGSLMYPGDPDGEPGNVINCRCTILPVI